MKKTNLFIATLFLATTVNAAVLTVDNKSSNSGAQYTSATVAVTAANYGDTILVAGSSISYGTVIVHKTLHFVGAGHKPNKQSNYPSTLDFILDVNNTDSASFSVIEGFSIGTLTMRGSFVQFLEGVVIKRNNISTVKIEHHTRDGLIVNNIIQAFNPTNANYSNGRINFIISNNILGSYDPYNTSAAIDATIGPVILDHNIFIRGNSAVSTLAGVDNCLFSNNIFYGYGPNPLSGVSNSSFSHNISYSTFNDTFPTTGTNSGGNNQIGVDPGFVSVSSFAIDYNHDFHLGTTSPGTNAGSGGTDIGIYGGTTPWQDGGASGSGFMNSQEPQFPQVNQMNINTVSVPQNDTLNVTVKGIKNN